jgi:hypothetical protein
MTRLRWEDQAWLAEMDHGVAAIYLSGCAFSARHPDLSDVAIARLEGAPHLAAVWEPLLTKAPSPARCSAYCCYIRTVIFYHRPYILRGPHPSHFNGRWKWSKGGDFAIFDEVETRLSWDDVIAFDGDEWEIGGGHVTWHAKRWWMRRWARRRLPQSTTLRHVA